MQSPTILVDQCLLNCVNSFTYLLTEKMRMRLGDPSAVTLARRISLIVLDELLILKCRPIVVILKAHNTRTSSTMVVK